MTRQEVKSKQVMILDEIYALQKAHPPYKNTCPGCSTCSQMRELGKKYEKLAIELRKLRGRNYKQVQAIVAKGRKASREDIAFLVSEMHMTKKEVAAALKIPYARLLENCKVWGIGQIFQRRTG